MKARRPHQVPLSAAALAILQRMHVDEIQPGDLLFHGSSTKSLLSKMALTVVLRRMNAALEGQDMPWVGGGTGDGITVAASIPELDSESGYDWRRPSRVIR